MRAQFIYEKFTQESDPISDLGIGSVISCRVGDKIKVKDKYLHVYLYRNKYVHDKKYRFTKNNMHSYAWLYPDNLVCIIKNIKRYKNNTMCLTLDLMNSSSTHVFNRDLQLTETHKLFLKYFERVK